MDIALSNNDYKAADLMLQYLSYYDYDHHSRPLNPALPQLIRKKIPRFKNYIDTRIRSTSQTQQIDRGGL